MRWTGLALCAAALLGCDGQAGPDYNGLPLAVLSGTVNNQSGIPPSQPIDAALLWRAPAGVDAIMSATQVTIEKTFPAQFIISIYLPAPASVQQQSTLPYAVANVGAIQHGLTPQQLAAGTGVLGRLNDPLLYYFEKDLPGGLLQQQYGALKKGYHLLSRTQTVDPATLAPAAVDACAQTLVSQVGSIAPADAQTECAQSLLSHTSIEVPMNTPLILQVTNP
jgi:hypothetical protein